MVGGGVGDRESQQCARKRASIASIGSTWLRYGGDLVGDWLGRMAAGDRRVSSRNRWRLSSLIVESPCR